MPNTNKLSNYRTTISTNDGKTSITYVNTAIVSFDADTVTLNSGGYQTVTTKRKMNQASNQFCLGYGVYQKDYHWYVDLPNGKTVEFYDGITINRTA